MALNAQISVNILAHETSDAGLSRTLRATPAAYAVALSDGTGANNAQVAWSATRTLAASSENLNLAALADSRGGSPATVTLTAVKAVYVRNKGTSSLAFAGAPFPSSGQTVQAGAVAMQCDPSAGGMAASGVTVTGTVGGSYEIVLLGEGSVS
jgi:hypothetical protein